MVTGYGVEDLRALPLQQWERLGGPAAYCHLEGSQGFVGALVAEIPPGKSLEPMRHLYEEQILILEGRGATTFWSDQHETNDYPGMACGRPFLSATQHSASAFQRRGKRTRAVCGSEQRAADF